MRWAVRSLHTRSCRIVLQSDSTVAVGALRKGRSSRHPLLRHCRRLTALTLAEQLTVEARWLPTTTNFAEVKKPGLRMAVDRRHGVMNSAGFTRGRRCPAANGVLGRLAAEVQRTTLVKDFKAALLAGNISGSNTPFAFRGVF